MLQSRHLDRDGANSCLPSEATTGDATERGDVATERVGLLRGARYRKDGSHCRLHPGGTKKTRVQPTFHPSPANDRATEQIPVQKQDDKCCRCRRGHTERVLVYPCAYCGHCTCLACMKKGEVGPACFVRCGCWPWCQRDDFDSLVRLCALQNSRSRHGAHNT